MTVNKQLSLIALSLAIIASTGCSTSQMREMNAALPWNKQEALELERVTTPTRIASIWSHDVLTGPNHQATQGFGGRLYFYNNEQQAVAATGKLVVYAFNDTEAKRIGQTASEQADRKYLFVPISLKLVYIYRKELKSCHQSRNYLNLFTNYLNLFT